MAPGNRYARAISTDTALIYSKWRGRKIFSPQVALQKIIEKHWPSLRDILMLEVERGGGLRREEDY